MSKKTVSEETPVETAPDDYKHNERKLELTARACHEAMRVLNYAVDKTGLPAWSEAGAPAQGRSIRGVVAALDTGSSETVGRPDPDADAYTREQYAFQTRKSAVFAKVARLVGSELGLRVTG